MSSVLLAPQHLYKQLAACFLIYKAEQLPCSAPWNKWLDKSTCRFIADNLGD